jgi:hypothetical protein
MVKFSFRFLSPVFPAPQLSFFLPFTLDSSMLCAGKSGSELFLFLLVPAFCYFFLFLWPSPQTPAVQPFFFFPLLDFRQKDKLKINFLKKNRFWKFSVARSEGKKKPKVQISPDFYIWFSLLKLNIIEVRFKIFLLLFLIYSKRFGEIFLLGMIATFFFTSYYG